MYVIHLSATSLSVADLIIARITPADKEGGWRGCERIWQMRLRRKRVVSDTIVKKSPGTKTGKQVIKRKYLIEFLFRHIKYKAQVI